MGMKQGAVRKPKQCKACGTVFIPTGNAAKFCSACGDFRLSAMERFYNATGRAKQGRQVGVGSGGMNEGECHDQRYREWFLMDVYREQHGQCLECWTDLEPASMLLHHLDHNRKHNVRSNIAGVCKRCHQIEHECWLAFRKA